MQNYEMRNDQVQYGNTVQSKHLQHASSITFHNLYCTAIVHLSNILDQTVRYSLVCTNPDNYLIWGEVRGFIQPGGTSKVYLCPKVYDKISQFNYELNSIQIVSWADQKQASTIKLNVQVEGLKDIDQQTRSELMRVIKVHSNCPGIPTDHVEYISQYVGKLGEIVNMRQTLSYIIFLMGLPTQIQPHALEHDSRIYSFSHPGTFTGFKQPPKPTKSTTKHLQPPKPIKASNSTTSSFLTMDAQTFPTLTLPVKQTLKSLAISQCQRYLIWYTAHSVILYNMDKQQSHRHCFQKFRVLTIKNYVCVVLQQNKNLAHFFKNIRQPQTVNFHYLQPDLMCFSNHQQHKTLYMTHRKKLEKQTFWPFFKDSQVQNSKLNKPHDNYIYKFQNFTSMVTKPSPDERLNFPSISSITNLQVNGKYLIFHVNPQTVVYHLGRKQIVVKVEKSMNILRSLKYYHSVNILNIVGSSQTGVYMINVDGMGDIYGAEIVQLKNQPYQEIGESKEGYLYLRKGHTLSHYNLQHRQEVSLVQIISKHQIMQACYMHDDCLILQKGSQQGSPCVQSLQTRYIPDLFGYCQ